MDFVETLSELSRKLNRQEFFRKLEQIFKFPFRLMEKIGSIRIEYEKLAAEFGNRNESDDTECHFRRRIFTTHLI